jgi:hypothetical protein
MPFDGASKTVVATQSMIVLAMIESFFEGGARWARRSYRTVDGKRCLLGAIEHVRRETGLIDNRAAEYLAGAINLRQLSKGLPLLGDTATATVIGFNDAFRRSYAEVVEVLSEAKKLATIDAGVVESRTGSVAYQPVSGKDLGLADHLMQLFQKHEVHLNGLASLLIGFSAQHCRAGCSTETLAPARWGGGPLE